ncbi:hypothetical protein [Dongia sp.]|uniref:hypothetical protein n=1 Tax=Dongia sp. TaxID=1977262 RepID=UPI0035B34BE3
MYQPYREYLIERHDFLVEQTRVRLLSQFADIAQQAEEFPDREWDRLQTMPWGEGVDGSQIAELVQDNSAAQYDLLQGLMFNLMMGALAGIYHEWDRNVREHVELELRHNHSISTDEGVVVWQVDFDTLMNWLNQFAWDVRSEPFFPLLDAARLIMNVFKHGKGTSFDELAERYPQYLRGTFHDEDVHEKEILTLLADHTFLSLTQSQLVAIGAAIREFWQKFPASLSLIRPNPFPKPRAKRPKPTDTA